MLDENPDEINWNILCEHDNGNATYIIKKYIDIIPFKCLCRNKFMINYIIEHLQQHCTGDMDKDGVYWNYLTENPSAVDFLKNHPNKINYDLIYFNPGIFDYDYEVINQRIDIYKKELLEKVLNPIRLMNICKKYDITFTDLMTNVYSSK